MSSTFQPARINGLAALSRMRFAALTRRVLTRETSPPTEIEARAVKQEMDEHQTTAPPESADAGAKV